MGLEKERTITESPDYQEERFALGHQVDVN